MYFITFMQNERRWLIGKKQMNICSILQQVKNKHRSTAAAKVP